MDELRTFLLHYVHVQSDKQIQYINYIFLNYIFLQWIIFLASTWYKSRCWTEESSFEVEKQPHQHLQYFFFSPVSADLTLQNGCNSKCQNFRSVSCFIVVLMCWKGFLMWLLITSSDQQINSFLSPNVQLEWLILFDYLNSTSNNVHADVVFYIILYAVAHKVGMTFPLLKKNECYDMIYSW